jgi:hypothetical protein
LARAACGKVEAECHARSTRQRRKIQNHLGRVFIRKGQRIAEDEATFCICVSDLDC